MEEILASIRRIIADDQETLQIVQTPVPTDEASPLRNVLDLTEQHLAAENMSILPEREAEAFFSIDEEETQMDEAPVIDFPAPFKAEPPVIQAPAEPVAEPRRAAPAASVEEPLLSRTTEAAIGNAFTRLDSTVAQSSPKTLEDLAKEMLRPMLKAWLDDNLPPMVERLVQAEIERVSRTRR
jgi:cell pole-organizing protein PopZ